jgi:hypothetical protein
MLKTGANVLSADLLHDLLLIAYRGQLYVQPTPDAEPLAVFDAQEVQRTLAAEGENRQTLAAALVAIRLGYAVRRFGGSRPLATAYTPRFRWGQGLLAAAEAMAAARLLLPPLGGPAGLAAALEAALRATFAQMEAGQTVALQPTDPAQLAQSLPPRKRGARAAIALALAVAGEAVDQDVMADAARLADRVLQASRREETPC